MLQFEVVEGHISIYDLITQHGLSKPGSVWKQLLRDHPAQLPPFVHKQFTMRDGRKGRLRPAVLLEDREHLQTLLQQVFPPATPWSVQEHVFLTLLEEVYPDFQPQRQVEVEGTTLDLLFPQPQLAIVLQSHFTDSTAALQKLEAVQVLVFDPHRHDFSPGRALYQVRKLLENRTLSSNP